MEARCYGPGYISLDILHAGLVELLACPDSGRHMGLPLSVFVALLAVHLILWFWPMF